MEKIKNVGDLVSREWILKRLMFETDRDIVRMAPAVEAVPFSVFPELCGFGYVTAVDADGKVFDRVCDCDVPPGWTWRTCSIEECPLLNAKKEENE